MNSEISYFKDFNLICFDADGVLFDTERFSHIAAYEVLSRFNHKLPKLDVFSNMLVGIRAKDQKFVIGSKFSQLGFLIIFPDDFEQQRDSRQRELFKERNINPITGVVKLLDYLSKNDVDFCISTRSRIEPLIQKLELTGLRKYFPDENIFYPEGIDDTSIAFKKVKSYMSKQLINEQEFIQDKGLVFAYSCFSMGYVPYDCVGIEDTISGVKSIISAKMMAIAFGGAESTNSKRLKVFANNNDVLYLSEFC